MTRKHFEAVAAAVAGSELSLTDQAHIAMRLADAFAAENPRFDRARFVDAAQRDATTDELMSDPNYVGSPIHY